MSTHYVAQLKIERIDKIDPASSRAAGAEPKREISEVTQITIKGETLNSLLDKLGKHVEIIEED